MKRSERKFKGMMRKTWFLEWLCWLDCIKCKKQFRFERGWVAWRSQGGTIFELCRKCAPTKNDADQIFGDM